MHKQCQCGKPMGLELRKVIYAGKVEILHVPVFSCSSCFSSEVLQHVTKDIKALLQSLGANLRHGEYLLLATMNWQKSFASLYWRKRTIPMWIGNLLWRSGWSFELISYWIFIAMREVWETKIG